MNMFKSKSSSKSSSASTPPAAATPTAFTTFESPFVAEPEPTTAEWPQWETCSVLVTIKGLRLVLDASGKNTQYGLGLSVACSDELESERLQHSVLETNHTIFKLRNYIDRNGGSFEFEHVFVHAVSLMRKCGYASAPVLVQVPAPQHSTTPHHSSYLFEKPLVPQTPQ